MDKRSTGDDYGFFGVREIESLKVIDSDQASNVLFSSDYIDTAAFANISCSIGPAMQPVISVASLVTFGKSKDTALVKEVDKLVHMDADASLVGEFGIGLNSGAMSIYKTLS